MRTIFASVAVLLGTALAQDAPDKGPTYSFALEQGWSLAAETEDDFPSIQETDLQQDYTPKFKPPLTPPSFPVRDRDGKIVPHHKGIAGPKPSEMWKGVCDPIKLEGSLTLLPGGVRRIDFRRIEYWDRSQRYWIEFDGDKVRTHGLGAVEKWSGTRAEWAARLARLEAAVRDAYLKDITPQKPAPGKDKIGLGGLAAQESAWRLFVAGALEDQMVALLLAHLDGVPLEPARWPAEIYQGPEQPRRLARQLIDRIQAQALGDFTPEPARDQSGRTLRDLDWHGTEIAVPTLEWTDGQAWARERLQPVVAARARLRALSEGALRRGEWMDPDSWRFAVEEEAKQLRKLIPVAVPALPCSFDDALLPRLRTAWKGSYTFREKSEVRDGQRHSSDADVRGTAPALEVIFYHSGMNVWRSSVIRLETWYKAKVTRE